MTKFPPISVLNDRIVGLLGLAYRGRKIILGEEQISPAFRLKIRLIIMSADLSEKPAERLLTQAKAKHIPVIVFPDRHALGAAFGKDQVAALAVIDSGLGRTLLKIVKEGDQYGKKEQ